jgi:hypothetical protein
MFEEILIWFLIMSFLLGEAFYEGWRPRLERAAGTPEPATLPRAEKAEPPFAAKQPLEHAA